MAENDLFMADTNVQSSIEKELRGLIQNYEGKIIELKNIYKDISTSDSWVDTNIKSNSLNTLNNYILSFENLRDEMEKQVNELSKNTNKVDSIEARFS